MSLHRLAAKRDANEPAIREALTAIGCKVIPISHRELADLIVAFRGMTLHVGVKAPDGPRGGTSHGRDRKSGDQRPASWPGGPWAIVTTPQEAVSFVLAATQSPRLCRCVNVPHTPEGEGG